MATIECGRACLVCGSSLEGRRADAITCSVRCRKELQRRRLPCEEEIDDAIAMTAHPADALLAAVVRLAHHAASMPEAA